MAAVAAPRSHREGAAGAAIGHAAQHSRVGKGLDPDSFDTALRELLADPSKKPAALRSGKAATVDPAVFAAAWHEAEAQRRQAAAKRRMAELEERPNQEREWRQQVQQRKEAEQKRRIADAQAAAAAAEEAAELAKLPLPQPEDNTPVGLARKAWAVEARRCEKVRAAAAAEYQEEHQQVLARDWEPSLERRREELRARRAEEAQQGSRQREEAASDARREAEAMAAEDASSAAFAAAAEAECARIAARGASLLKAEVAEVVRGALRQRRSELQWQQVQADEQIRASEEDRRREDERKEREYREWREKVRLERCCQQRLRERDEQPCDPLDADAIRKLELQGRDFHLERQLQHKAHMEVSMQQASKETQRLREAGGSPRRRLEEARSLAERQRCIKDEKEPERVEQELWDAMLAKNRLAKCTKPGNTPRAMRWGAL